MAFDNFIGWSMQAKKDMLLAVQQARLTGQVTRSRTDSGVETQFDPAKVNLSNLLREIEQSIANDANYDAADPVQLACKMNQRPGRTTPVFC